MGKHTPVPWLENNCTIFDSRREAVAYTGAKFDKELSGIEECQANAARIVACVNACEGINPEAVPEMLKALRVALKFCRGDDDHPRAFEVIQKAIAKAELQKGEAK